MDKLYHNWNHIGFIQMNVIANPVLYYNISGEMIQRSEIGIPSGILVLKEKRRNDYPYGCATEFSIANMSQSESECIVIISGDDRLIYRTVGNEEWASSGKTNLLSENALITRIYDEMVDEHGRISFDYMGDGKYHSRHLPCLIDLHSHNYREYTYIYHDSDIIIAVNNIESDDNILYVFDLHMNVLYSSNCHFHFCRLYRSEKYPKTFIYKGQDYYFLNLSRNDGEIVFVEEKLDGFWRLGFSKRLIPIDWPNDYHLFQNQEKLIVADLNNDIISFICLRDRNKRTLVDINERMCLTYVCPNEYDICYITDFHNNILFSTTVLYDNICIIKREVIGVHENKRMFKYGVCYYYSDENGRNTCKILLPILYDDISIRKVGTEQYLIATIDQPNGNIAYGFYISNSQEPPSLTEDSFLNGDVINHIKVINEYDSRDMESVRTTDNIVYGYNMGEKEKEWETIKLPNPIIIAVNHEGKSKLCVKNCFSTDYEYDGIRQLYISPSMIWLYMRVDSSKRQLLNYIYVYKTGESGDRFCGIMDCNGNIVMPIKYKRIVNYNCFVLADQDVYLLNGDSFNFVCKIEEDCNLIALCGNYMAFEEGNGNTFVIDNKGKRYYISQDYNYIDLSDNVYYDLESGSFWEVERNVPDYDSGPSWEELGKEEEDYIINNGGDWIFDVG